MKEIRGQFGEFKGYSPGNVKIFVSQERLIYKVYPFDIITDRVGERKRKEKETREVQKALNLENKRIDLLGFGLCNKWQYFFTGTIDPEKYIASDYNVVSKLISHEFYKMRKKDKNVNYCFILEKHKNGNYHAHGFINIPGYMVNPFPYYERSDLKKIYPSKSKFIQYGIKQCFYSLGLNTISPISDLNNIADYCAKYMTKNISTGDYCAKSIFKSHGLKKFDIQYGSYLGDSFPSLDEIYQSEYNCESVHHMKKFYNENIFTFEIKLK